MKHFTILLIFTVLLSGCARKTPTEEIIDNHVAHIGEVLEFSYNNLEQTAGVMFLEGELKSCQIALEDVRQTHISDKSGWEGKIRYWRLMSVSLMVLLVLAVFGWIKRIVI